MKCIWCGSVRIYKNGYNSKQEQQYLCADCRKAPFKDKYGNPASILSRVVDSDKEPEPSIAATEIKSVPMSGISLVDFRSKHDPKFILIQKVGDLKKGVLVLESKFIEYCKMQGLKYRDIIDGDNFSIYRGKASGKMYWSHPETIAALKEETLLS